MSWKIERGRGLNAWWAKRGSRLDLELTRNDEPTCKRRRRRTSCGVPDPHRAPQIITDFSESEEDILQPARQLRRPDFATPPAQAFRGLNVRDRVRLSRRRLLSLDRYHGGVLLAIDSSGILSPSSMTGRSSPPGGPPRPTPTPKSWPPPCSGRWPRLASGARSWRSSSASVPALHRSARGPGPGAQSRGGLAEAPARDLAAWTSRAARRSTGTDRRVPAPDARRREIYWACTNKNHLHLSYL